MMKLLFLIAFLSTANINFAQKPVPSLKLLNLNNKVVSTSLISDSEITLLNFWATWCIPCIDELNAIHEVYEDWQEQFDFKLIAISIDDNRTISRVKPMVNSNEWAYEIWLDKNQDFKRALQISNIPYLLMVKNGTIVFQQTGYKPGNEDLIYSKIQEFSK